MTQVSTDSAGFLCRFGFTTEDGPAGFWGWISGDEVRPVFGIDPAFRAGAPLADLAGNIAASGPSVSLASLDFPPTHSRSYLLPPIHSEQEIWAAGVTYESSKFARMAESEGGGDFYAKVYVADRPELFFKATPRRVVGPNGALRIRADSDWNVPEPELAAVIAANGKIVGYTIGNDMSSRSIEGENPLYLPQAKVYTGSCALGPWIVPAESVDPQNLAITMTIRRGDSEAFHGETSTARMKRNVLELAEWLFRENDFPGGAILLTGTGIIPPESFTLHSGDWIEITVDRIGTLRNVVA